MTNNPTPSFSPDHARLIDSMVDSLLDAPEVFGVLGEVIRRAAPLIDARRRLDDMPESMEP